MSYLGQYNNCHGVEHWTAANCVLRYLKGAPDVGLSYQRDDQRLKGFVDADWCNCPDHRRSYTGYVFVLGGSPISWDAKKQSTVALSTTEAEYMALSECAKEAIYLQRFLRELGHGEISLPIVYCDNRSAFSLADNPVFHARTKHIDVRHHFVRHAKKKKQLDTTHISTSDQIADFLTKALPRPKYAWCVKAAGLHLKN